MRRFNKLSALILYVMMLGQSVAYAAWPSVSARTKTWGAEVLTAADLHGQFDIIHTYINAMMHATTGHGHTGSTNDGPKLNIAAALKIASQATGDLIYASSSTAFARLGIGSSGQYLGISGGVPAWVSANTPLNYRSEMNVMQASTTTMTVSPGTVEINGSLVSKTSNTTLTLTTAGNWAGGSSQQATSTLGFVIIDSSGNIKMTTTAPTHADYAVSITAANNTKRYATVSGTVYRYIGWFYMNATGSGELDTYNVSNLLDVGVRNVVEFETGAAATGTATTPYDDTIPQVSEVQLFMTQVFRATNVNNKLKIDVRFNFASNGSTQTILGLFQDATASALAAAMQRGDSVDKNYSIALTHYMKAATISATTFKAGAGDSAGGTVTFNGFGGNRKLGGVIASSISVEEIPSQLT